jgi:hypothetical protein
MTLHVEIKTTEVTLPLTRVAVITTALNWNAFSYFPTSNICALYEIVNLRVT